MYNKLVTYWKSLGVHNSIITARLSELKSMPKEDICAVISDVYGIFDATMKGNVYTYYFYNCDTLNYKLRGKKNWYKGADIFKVTYNVKTEELKIVKCKRFNARCTENRCRML